MFVFLAGGITLVTVEQSIEPLKEKKKRSRPRGPTEWNGMKRNLGNAYCYLFAARRCHPVLARRCRRRDPGDVIHRRENLCSDHPCDPVHHRRLWGDGNGQISGGVRASGGGVSSRTP